MAHLIAFTDYEVIERIVGIDVAGKIGGKGFGRGFRRGGGFLAGTDQQPDRAGALRVMPGKLLNARKKIALNVFKNEGIRGIQLQLVLVYTRLQGL
jgi:hypothetical protein